MSALGCVPRHRGLVSVSSCPDRDRGYRRETMAVQMPVGGWNSALRTSTCWPSWEEPDDRPCSKPRQYLETQGLKRAADVLNNTLDTAASKLLTYSEMLEQLLGSEVAHFPFQRNLEQLDFAFQPSTDQRQVKELADLALVAEATNILMLGPPGVGKTHLAVALAEKTIKRGYGSYFARGLRADEGSRSGKDRRDLHLRLPGAPPC